MQQSQLTYIALMLAQERAREAERYHRHREALIASTGPGPVRRLLARIAAAVSVGATAVGRRLDACTFDSVLIDSAPAPGYRSAR